MSELVEKIKNMINKSYADKFGVDVVNNMKFIPIDEVQKGTFYAAINDSSQTSEIEKKIKEITNLPAKFVPLGHNDYNELLEYFKKVLAGQVQQKAPHNAPAESKKRIGDMLKDAGVINEQQIVEALV